MTVVNINLKNVGSNTSPIDSVTFYSPVYRDGTTTSELVSTAEQHVYLVNGVGSVNLAPGPVRVRFAVRGIADTVAKDGIVPNDGPVSLNDVIRGSLTYTPAIVDTILASVSDRVANEMDNRIPSDLSLRLDTTVGTRIFAGTTMVYGDTGWRDVSASLLSGATGKALIRRKDTTVYIRLSDISTPGFTIDTNILDIPLGFRQDQTRILHHLGPTDTQNANVMLNTSMWFLRVSNNTIGKMCGYTLELNFECTSLWPLTLPGLPA